MIPNYIKIESPLNDSVNSFIRNKEVSKVFILVDENTEKHCLSKIKIDFDAKIIKIQSGESNKTLNTCCLIWNELTKENADRKSLLINLGGGVIGDMGGFCASTYKRGIYFINIPTTLLSQVDASIGGKLGIDYNGLKNHIGLFRDPDQVFINNNFLQTLPERQLLSGYAEVVKHALIADSAWWEKIKKIDPLNVKDWSEITLNAIRIKGEVVSNDPTEKGLRKILNFGHTIGHAIESWFLENYGDNACLHGEAIAAGMIIEADLSTKFSGLSKNDFSDISNYILNTFRPLHIPEKAIDKIVNNCVHDKKNKGNKISFVLLNNIGESTFDEIVSLKEVRIAVENYMQLISRFSDQTPKS
ncbi:3-dehydroquinate synthase [Mangrovivirga sp. M17]|uniref:3-dehydroquinate synthase n=1 Tax=Mangrovivirga halotolerans TaxID=2993936 RepID=A0ABT3RTU9_9BACT|nr:3-dehydroquinate synthase [Mangrovivirga halotolerans]MCX2745002.1 3-dehydroquinate synthase [Mangrovivirga halotolerans]